MKSQPNRNYVSNDVVQTPVSLARALVAHFEPSGIVLEPCKGEGNILRFLPKGSPWCELSKGRDFFDWTKKVDWVFTNPPWSKIRPFLQHSLSIADDVVFLVTVNHLWTKARLRIIEDAGFGIQQIVLVDTPKSFPSSGFQLGAIHLTRGWQVSTAITRLDYPQPSGFPSLLVVRLSE
jgi:hypothetical protein